MFAAVEHQPVNVFGWFELCSLADCVLVTATRDGMNLVPYEYVVCRNGNTGEPPSTNPRKPPLSRLHNLIDSPCANVRGGGGRTYCAEQ